MKTHCLNARNRTKQNRIKHNRNKKQQIMNMPESIVNVKELDIYQKDK